MRAIAAAIVASLLLSGCVSCEEGPPVTARGINTAPASGGVGGYDLDILLTDGPGGPPLGDAGVLVYWSSTESSDWDGGSVHPSEDVVIYIPAGDQRTVDPDHTIRVKSNADGMVRTNPPAERIVGVVAAKDGFTEEWLGAVSTGARGDGDTLTLPLYREILSYTHEDSWGPGAASSGVVTSSNYEWQPHAAQFGSTDDAHRGYAARIVELQVTLTWTNDQTGVGDLGIGIGNDPGSGPTFFHDNDNNAGQGEQTESVILNVQELIDHNIIGGVPIQIGPATQSGYVAPIGGLSYTMEINARFDAALADLKACQGGANIDDNEGIGVSTPGWGPVGAIAALAVLASLGRFKSQ